MYCKLNSILTIFFLFKVEREVSDDEKRIWNEFRKYSCHIEVMYKPTEEEQSQGIGMFCLTLAYIHQI